MRSIRQSAQNAQFLSSLAQNAPHLLVASHADKRIERANDNGPGDRSEHRLGAVADYSVVPGLSAIPCKAAVTSSKTRA
jgi:hypothetical protein